MSDYNSDLAKERHVQLLRAIEGIHERLDTLNGRTRANEIKLGILEERSPGKSGVVGGSIGAGIVGAAALLLEWLKR